MNPAARRESGNRPLSRRIGVLISGRGSNLSAILDRIEAGTLDAEVAVVICNRPEAGGAAMARQRGIDTVIVDHRESSSREAHDRRMAELLEARDVALVCLAGYMRLLSSWFIERFRDRILNIHPSLLPAFPGTDAQRAALEAGATVSGCTVHFVEEGVDSGPIVLQEEVPVHAGDTPDSLAARILEREHLLYSRAIDLFLSGRLKIVGRQVVVGGERQRR